MTNWHTTKIEKTARQLLFNEMAEKGDEIFAKYLTARKSLVEEILPNIKKVLPSHTDHGETHVADVLEKAYALLDSDVEKKINPIDLYILITAILFHDVGNIYDRDNHNKAKVIKKIYDYVRSEADFAERNERLIILKICEAHCGYGPDGSKDTLKTLRDPLTVNKHPVNPQPLAAVLRLADELAEGPHRTSHFMQKNNMYDKKSKIFHKYSSIVDIVIDKKGGRIALTYNIDIKTSSKNVMTQKREKELRDLLSFIYKRIVKVDEERKYNKFYAPDLLSEFTKTTVAINFFHNDLQLHLPLEPIPDLSDLVIPGKHTPDFVRDHAPSYDPILLSVRVLKHIQENA